MLLERALPEGDTRQVVACCLHCLGTPKGECPGYRPRMACENERQGVQAGQRQSSRHERPWVLEKTWRVPVGLAWSRPCGPVTALNQPGGGGDGGEQQELHSRRLGPPDLFTQRYHTEGRSPPPEWHVKSGDKRARNEPHKRENCRGVASSYLKEGARRSAAAKLHADTEDERTDQHRHAGRGYGTPDRTPEDFTESQHRGKE